MTRMDRRDDGAGAAPGARIGFVQTGPVFGEVARNLATAGTLVREAPDFDLLVLPELFASGYLFRNRAELEELAEDADGPTGRWLRGLAGERGGWIAAGFPERNGASIHNAAALAGPRGEWHVYRKIHLFDREKELFEAGREPFRARDVEIGAGRARVGLMICFDWYFPEAARSLALDGAEILLHPSNLVLPHCQGAMPTRCLENRVWAVTANRFGADDRGDRTLSFTGRSQITAPDGTVAAAADERGEAVRVVEADLAAARTKRVTAGNDLFADRRPDLYRA
jgi:predicted amidohydrolase